MAFVKEVLQNKRHFLVFVDEQLIIGTDDLSDIGRQQWFQDILRERVISVHVPQPIQQPVRQPVQPVQVPQPQQAQQPLTPTPTPQPPRRQVAPSVMDITPDQMDDNIWATMSPQIRNEWMAHYNLHHSQ